MLREADGYDAGAELLKPGQSMEAAGPSPGWGGPGNHAYNSTGSEVTKLQTRLNLLGAAPPLVVDGIFGSNTWRAVVSFQTRSGLSPDGIVGPNTKTAIRTQLRATRGFTATSGSLALLHADGEIDALEAPVAVGIAASDAKLAPDETDSSLLSGALIGVLTRSGVPLPGARAAAPAIVTLAQTGAGSPVSIDKSADLPTLVEASRSGKATQIGEQAEEDVRGNAKRLEPWSLSAIKADPAGFMRHVTQQDGDVGSTRDRSYCGGAALVGGIILASPAKFVEMATLLLTPASMPSFPAMQVGDVRAALERVKGKAFAPVDASLIAGALVESVQVETEAGRSNGMPSQQQLALIGRLRQIGLVLPKLSLESYGTQKHRQGPHMMAIADDTGYDPFAYAGNGGHSTVVAGAENAREHGRHISDRVGVDHEQVKPGLVDPRTMLERFEMDGEGNLIVERGVVAGQVFDPPLRAKYVFHKGASVDESKWRRVGPAPIPGPSFPNEVGIGLEDLKNPQMRDLSVRDV